MAEPTPEMVALHGRAMATGMARLNAEKERALADIVSAWTVEGRNPVYHRRQQSRLEIEWPALYQAIRRAVEASGG